MKKFAIVSIALPILLSSCGMGDTSPEKETVKTDYLLETISFDALKSSYTLEKSSKIEASDEVQLSSEAMGRVSSITVKEGDVVEKGQQLVYIADSSLNLNNSYSQALVNLEQARLAYESNQISLDKAIFDANLQVENLQNSLATTKATLEQNLKQAKDSLENANPELEDSKSALDLQKLENSIAKMELDYENQVQANKEQIATFIVNLQKEKINLEALMKSTTDFGDDVYRISPDKVEAPYEVFLGAQDPTLRDATEEQIKELMQYEETTFANLSITSEAEIDAFITEMDIAYAKVEALLTDMKEVLNKSLVSIGRFSETDKQLLLNQVNGLISQYQGQYAGYVATKNGITTFVNTYENTLESLQKQIDLARKDIDITKKSLKSGELAAEINYDKLVISGTDAVTGLELQLKNAKNTLENAKKTREASLKNLANSIRNAELAVARAGSEVSKLTLKAPISGVVGEVLVNEGQTYGAGTPFLTLLSNSKRELDVFLPMEDMQKISLGDQVSILYGGETYNGEVFSKGTLADANLNYRVKVSLDRDISLIGGIADVVFTLSAAYPLIPVNAVNVLESEIDRKIAEIQVYEEGKIVKKIVEIGKVYGTNIELLSDLAGAEIIVNDTSNYNPEEHNLLVGNK